MPLCGCNPGVCPASCMGRWTTSERCTQSQVPPWPGLYLIYIAFGFSASQWSGNDGLGLWSSYSDGSIIFLPIYDPPSSPIPSFAIAHGLQTGQERLERGLDTCSHREGMPGAGTRLQMELPRYLLSTKLSCPRLLDGCGFFSRVISKH